MRKEEMFRNVSLHLLSGMLARADDHGGSYLYQVNRALELTDIYLDKMDKKFPVYSIAKEELDTNDDMELVIHFHSNHVSDTLRDDLLSALKCVDIFDCLRSLYNISYPMDVVILYGSEDNEICIRKRNDNIRLCTITYKE